MADLGSKITPSGKIIVPSGESQKFVFNALPGCTISAVIVDGKPLTQDKVALGYYTFTNVKSNHSIKVVSTSENLIILTIDVVEGEGKAKFSVNGGPFQKYEGPVLIPINAHLMVQASPDEGYKFKEWRSGAISYKTSEVDFVQVTESLHLDLYFTENKGSTIGGLLTGEDGGFPWWIAGVFLLVLAGLLFFFFLVYRRYYDVHKDSPRIEGDDTVHRKSEYVFTVTGGNSGDVYYRIKEDGEWKLIFRNADGQYVVPKDEVVGDIYLEIRE
jgi:hypothetical protein